METLKLIIIGIIILIISAHITGFYTLLAKLKNQKPIIIKPRYQKRMIKRLKSTVDSLKKELTQVKASNDRHMIKRINQGLRIADLEIAFGEAAKELSGVKKIKEWNESLRKINDILTSENLGLIAENNGLSERINKMEAKIGHKKYVPLNEKKQEPIEKWKCNTDVYMWFQKGKTYSIASLKCWVPDYYIALISDNGQSFVVDKNLFVPE